MNGLNLFRSIYTQFLKKCKNMELAMAYACDLILQLQDANYKLGRIANINIDESDDYSEACRFTIRYNGRDEFVETSVCKNRMTKYLDLCRERR